ncbi:MAG: autotransporter-associated beta strand repeat-containing protein [Prevotella sp.]|nr:autotransporter-associated beta strand repeat-containing protein [Prevotella sp.]
MKKFTLCCLFAVLLPMGAQAQRIVQKLSRGVTAVNRTQGDIRFNAGTYLISWRRWAEEPESTLYRVYINGTQVAETSNTNYVPSTLRDGDVVTVNPVYDSTEDATQGGSYTYKQRWANAFMDIDFETTVCPADSFRTPFVFPGDLDGDGETDWVVIRNTAVASYNTMAQAYKSDGTYLWTIDFGPNLNPVGGQNCILNVYDINCDGKAELVTRTSDGTRFWDKAKNTWGLYVKGSTTGDVDGDGIIDYTKVTNRNAPFYMSVINGETGAEMDVCELNYSELQDGADHYGRDNRADYMNDGNGQEYAFMTGHNIVTYDDGMHPMIMSECLDRTKADGRHHNYVLGFTYDWDNGVPSNWHHSYTWSRNDKTPWPAEFHQLRAADVDGDGRDEMLQGGYGVNTHKDMVFSAGIGHGDRFRTSDLDPTHPGMETYVIQQSNLLGQLVYDAATGKHLKEWYLPSVVDVGRGECMDIDSTHLGYEIYSTMANCYDIKGNVVHAGSTPYPYEGVWWDGDLGREKLGSPGGSGYSTNAHIEKDYGGRLAELSRESGWATHSEWANRAGFWGDITGDWREEVVLMKQSNDKGATGIVGYTTNEYTPYSMYCLMQDPHYLLDCTSRGYYQAPNTSFYLGYQMKRPPLPGTMSADLRWSKGGSWDTASSNFVSFDGKQAQAFQKGKSVIFDITGDTTQVIALNATVEPSKTYFMVPKEHSYTISGAGAIGGTGEVWKSERGLLTLNANISTTGKTVVSNGVMLVNGTISGPVSVRGYGSLGGKATLNGDVDFEGSLNYEGSRLLPQEVMTFGKSLTITNNVYDEVTLGNGTVDKLMVNGDLKVNAPLVFTINATSTDNKLLAGDYTLVEATGTITLANDTLLSVRSLEGQPYSLKVVGNKIVLNIPETRAAAEGVKWEGASSNMWDYTANNFNNAGESTYFVQHDKVSFGDDAQIYDVMLSQKMIQNGVTFNNAKDYTLNGEGGLSGEGDLVKNGEGNLVINTKNNDFTGQTIINGGTLTVKELNDAGYPSSIGAGVQNIKIAGGTLKIVADNVATDRGIEIADTATINVANASGAVSLKGLVTGADGVLVKDGPGQLNFTYPGLYTMKALVMKGGILAQGSSSATFGNVQVYARGGNSRINLIVNGSYPSVVYNHPTDISEEATLTIGGGQNDQQRGIVQGSYTGKGTLCIPAGGVRFYVNGDFSNFEGTLNFQGSTALRENVTDMKKLTLTLNDASAVYHINSSFAGTAAALQVGALADPTGVSSYATQPTFGGSSESWEVGYNNQDASYSGVLTAKNVTKVGTGAWALNGAGSTSSIVVAGGQLFIRNSSGTLTTGTVTVQDSGYVAGYGTTNSIIVKQGGTLSAGVARDAVGILPLKTASNLIVYSGGTLLVKAGTSLNDKFQIGGTMCRFMSGAKIRVEALNGRAFAAGDEITVFNAASRKPTIPTDLIVESNDGSQWSTELLATDGKLVCVATTGINGLTIDDSTPVIVYSLDGKMVRQDVPFGTALDDLAKGVYIINGKKVVKK